MAKSRKQGDFQPTREEVTAFRDRFEWLLGPARGLRRNPSAFLNAPETFMARARRRIQAAMEKRVREVGVDQFARDLAGVGLPRRLMLEGFARMADNLREEERQIAVLPGGAGLLGLLGAADAGVRNSPLILALDLKALLGQNTLHSIGQLERASRLRGEHACHALLRVVADAAEKAYLPYLEQVWNLTEFAIGRVPHRPPNGFGKLVTELEKRIGTIRGVVEPLALRVRNAADHGHLHEYDTETGRMHLKNDRPLWTAQMGNGELRDLAAHIITTAGKTYPRAVHWFLQRAWLESGLFGAILGALPALERNDPKELEIAGREIEARILFMYADIARVRATSAKGGEHLAEAAARSDRWLKRTFGASADAIAATALPAKRRTRKNNRRRRNG